MRAHRSRRRARRGRRAPRAPLHPPKRPTAHRPLRRQRGWIRSRPTSSVSFTSAGRRRPPVTCSMAIANWGSSRRSAFARRCTAWGPGVSSGCPFPTARRSSTVSRSSWSNEETDIFRKVLIANRGEIALRINRACQELGVSTVAIFSEADRESLHVRQADEAFCVGPGPAARSYLNIPNIISTALITHCDAVHPGYGFLAENARFAEICGDHGSDVHRPEAERDRAMGDKATAKRVMHEAGVATTPGSDVLASVDEAARLRKRSAIRCCSRRPPAAAGAGCASCRDRQRTARVPTRERPPKPKRASKTGASTWRS